MFKLKPDVYQKDVLSIDYKKLKKLGIKVLLFDFDNTLIERGNYSINKDIVKLFDRIKKDFDIYIVSNSIHERKLRIVTNQINVSYIKGSRKPLKTGFNKLKLKGINNSEIAMIGDQLMTDVLGGKRMNYFTILVDPIDKNEWLLTRLNRFLEKIYFKKNSIVKGEYYD